jgi:hypothetical protein
MEVVAMRLLAQAILLAALAGAGQGPAASAVDCSFSESLATSLPAPAEKQAETQDAAQQAPASPLTLPAGTRVMLAMTRALWSKTAKPGDSIYAATAFPVAGDNGMAIPPGTFAEGRIDTLAKPGWLSAHAALQLHFTKMIFANGYTVEFSGASEAVATVQLQVSKASDVLLDNGTQFEMVLQSPLTLDAEKVAGAVRSAKPLPIGAVKSATLCRPTAGTPGTSDTVIPGTPGSPGTPDTIIPGVNGMPDTVIPGIPATQGTPPTIIPGTPGTPGTVCPGPPIVLPGAVVQDVYVESFQITETVKIAGKKLPPGNYQVSWTGMLPTEQVQILKNGKVAERVPARVMALKEKSVADKTTTRRNPDGSLGLETMEFVGESFALAFD